MLKLISTTILILLATASVALADATGVTTKATNVTAHAATLHGTVTCAYSNPRAVCPTYFTYGSLDGGGFGNTAIVDVPTGTHPVASRVTGLLAATTYYFQICTQVPTPPGEYQCNGPADGSGVSWFTTLS